MNKYTLTLDSVIIKTISSGQLFRLRFFSKDLKKYIYDTIPAASIRLQFFLSAAKASNIDEAIGATITALVAEKKGFNKTDNTPYSTLIIAKYLGGNNND